jgi:hypothetical protein
MTRSATRDGEPHDRYDAVPALLAGVLQGGNDGALRAHMMRHSALPGPRLDLRLVDRFARAVGDVALDGTSDVDRLEAVLDAWAALSDVDAPVTEPAVVLPCSAVAAYGEVGAVRPEWWPDEVRKLRRAASDRRWRVREMVAVGLQRMLHADGRRTSAELLQWAGDDDPLVVRGAVAATADPPLLRRAELHAPFTAIQQRAVDTFHAISTDRRRDESTRVLRQALGFTLGVVAAGTNDPTVLVDAATLAASGDVDLAWVVRRNLASTRLVRRRDLVAPVEARLDAAV